MSKMKRKVMSPEARKRISEGMKRRYALLRQQSGVDVNPNPKVRSPYPSVRPIVVRYDESGNVDVINGRTGTILFKNVPLVVLGNLTGFNA